MSSINQPAQNVPAVSALGTPATNGQAQNGPKPPSQATKLVDLAMANYQLGVSTDGKAFGYRKDAPHVALDLRGGKLGLRAALARSYFRVHQAAPTQSALTDCLNVLEGMALEKTPTALYVRVAGDADAIYIDMADTENHVIEIKDGVWSVVATSPYMFRRTEVTAPMIHPLAGGKINAFWRHVNIVKEDKPLLLAFLVDSLIQPNTSKPVASLQAEHGSAKSTTAKRVVELIDPSPAPLCSPPKDLENWLSSAAASWVVALDNLSNIPDWLSDALCRAATGDGSKKRRLYTDDSLSVIKFRRSVIITGIDVGGLNGDLVDRLVPIELLGIDDVRKSETELEELWQAESPGILGGLLTMAAAIHHKLPAMEQVSLPRMADFGRVLACVDMMYNTNGLERYRSRGKHMMTDSAYSHSFIARVIAKKYDTKGVPKTGAQILEDITPSSDGWGAKPIDWPKKPRNVTTLLHKHAPAMRLMGWIVENDDGRNKEGTTKWNIKPPPPEKP